MQKYIKLSMKQFVKNTAIKNNYRIIKRGNRVQLPLPLFVTPKNTNFIVVDDTNNFKVFILEDIKE